MNSEIKAAEVADAKSDSVVSHSVVTVKKNLKPRYHGINRAPLSEQTLRPTSWDERFEGIEEVELEDGRIINIFCSGQQSSPEAGWTLFITGEKDGVSTWTLFGIKKI